MIPVKHGATGKKRRAMKSFKVCPKCGRQWVERSAFLSDPDLTLVGYQVNFKELAAGMLLFNHSCRTTLALLAMDFRDLHAGPVFVERLTGSDECPGMCLHKDNLGPCPARCECAYVRDILQVIRTWPKAAAQGGARASRGR